jgi:hypothetical protein
MATIVLRRSARQPTTRASLPPNCLSPAQAAAYFTRLYKLLALPRPPATLGLVLTNSSAESLSMARAPSQFGNEPDTIG